MAYLFVYLFIYNIISIQGVLCKIQTFLNVNYLMYLEELMCHFGLFIFRTSSHYSHKHAAPKIKKQSCRICKCKYNHHHYCCASTITAEAGTSFMG